MMKRSHLLSVTVVGGFLFLTGCQDEASRASTEQAEALQTTASEYTKTVLTNPDLHMASHSSEAASKLSSLGSMGGSSGAGAMLNASVETDLALAALAKAEAIAANNRAARTEVRGLIDAARSLHQQAARHTAALTDSEQRVLEAAQAETQQKLETARIGLEQLTSPIASLEQQVQTNRGQIDSMRAQSRNQREKAFDAGDLEGFPFIQEAVRIDGDADTLERNTADLELKLGQLQAQRATLTMIRDQAQQALASFQATAGELQNAAQSHRQEAQRLTSEASTFDQQAKTKLDAIHASMNGELNDHYGSAAQHAEQAVMKAGASGSTPAARLTKVRALQSRARAFSSKMRGIIDHAMVAQLAGQSTGDLVSAYKAAAEEAKSAYTEAIETLSQGAGDVNPATVNELRSHMQAGIDSVSVSIEDMLAGAEIAMPERPAGLPSGAGAPSMPSGPMAKGASSPQELLSILKGLDGAEDPSQIVRMFDLVIVDQLPREDQQMFTMFGNILRGFASLESALQERFNRGLPESAAGGMGGGMSGSPADFGDLVLGEVSGDRGMIIATKDGERTDVPIVKRGDGWFILMTPQLLSQTQGDMAGGMRGGMGGGEGMEMDDEMAKQMMQGMLQMFSAVGQVMERLANDVRVGKYSSYEQFEAAMNQAMAEMMGFGEGGGMFEMGDGK